MESIIESVMGSIMESVKESTIEFRNPLFSVFLQRCNSILVDSIGFYLILFYSILSARSAKKKYTLAK